MNKLKSICIGLHLFLLITYNLFSQVTPIGEPINSKEMYEFNPCLSGNGRTIIFESSFSANDRPILEISTQKNGVWSKKEEVTGAFHTITSLSSNGGFFLSNDGNTLLFHSKLPKTLGHYDIWIMERNILGAWSKAQNLGTPINSALPEIDASISADGKYLFFTRIAAKEKTPSGYPCGKLYVSENVGKTWKAPVALPSPINMGCECAGRMLADNKTFLFASMRVGGLGGYDIYKTVLNDDGTWLEPVPYNFINTSKDDKYVSVPAAGNMIYYSAPDKTGALDIVKAKIPEELQPSKITLLQGTVKNASNKVIVIPKIIVTNTNTNKSTQYIGAKDGSYIVPVPQDKDVYDVAIMANDGSLAFKSLLFFPPKIPKFEEQNSAILLSHYKPGFVSPLNNIAFINNTDSLQAYSAPEIARIFQMLKSHITLKIEIGVHTNIIQKDTVFRAGLTAKIIDTIKTTDASGAEIRTLKTTYSSDNTMKQAQTIADILIKKGIPVERIIPKGYGTSQPLNPIPTDPNLNKRVELKIIHH